MNSTDNKKAKDCRRDDDSKNSTFFRRVFRAFFAPSLDIRIRLFNILGFGGVTISTISVFSELTGGRVVNALACAASAIFALLLLIWTWKSGRYQISCLITIVVIFLILFPVMFFGGHGYHSAMPMSFMFAVCFTVFMLDGPLALIMAAVEIVFYSALCFIYYKNAANFPPFRSEFDRFIDIVVTFFVESTIIGISLYLHFRLYKQQQKKLDEQNIMLSEAYKTKTELISNASHEMRTPLTVISVNVQSAMEVLESSGDKPADPEVMSMLANAHMEIMRLARMVGSSLQLSAMSEQSEKKMLDFSTLLNLDADVLRLNLQRKGNELRTDIEDGLKIFGDARLLEQVITNLLQNAGTYTQNGEIRLSAHRKGGEIVACVRDNGSGIEPEMLPRVFERGVTTGGTGFGLFLCKMVVESHGGNIWIESEPGKGTAVYFTLPVYGGQIGGD
ncbi:MAG TPA: HAMP domain-containing sensor histidine kinase [Bacillota bacterium]|nr:HAMP domain-containing sensor histidine kinase [Bacillota bacterium]HQC35549.1 HAMP domain-containing sensor histidine kinase [Bacillota bacterium]